MKLKHITEKMTLKEIMDLHLVLEEKLQKLGFDICCGKMSTIEESCNNKGFTTKTILESLNQMVDEINKVENLIMEMEE